MAEATISPTVMAVGDSQIHNAWLWQRELLRKAGKGFAAGATRVQVTITRAANTAAGAAVIAGAQIGLATRVGWDYAAKVATKGVGLIAKGLLHVARGVSWVMNKVGQGLAWFVGLFSQSAGDSISNGNAHFTAWRRNALSAGFDKVDQGTFMAYSAVTTRTASTAGRVFAGTVGTAAAINIVTGGAVAAKVAATVGPYAASLLGPVGLLATAAVGAIAGFLTWLFKRDEVHERAYDIAMSRVEVSEAKIEGLIVDLTADGGAVIKGDPDAVAAVMADPDAQRAVLRNAKLAQQQAPANNKPDPKLVTNAVVKEALRQEGLAVANNNGDFAKSQMDRMRTDLRSGDYPMPVSEQISA